MRALHEGRAYRRERGYSDGRALAKIEGFFS
jgi:hypothetical protein